MIRGYGNQFYEDVANQLDEIIHIFNDQFGDGTDGGGRAQVFDGGIEGNTAPGRAQTCQGRALSLCFPVADPCQNEQERRKDQKTQKAEKDG